MTSDAMQQNAAAVPQTGLAARQAIRRGDWTGPTAGLAPGFVQGNLAILPGALAADFMRFCQLNPKPCPLLAVGAPGDPHLPSLAGDLDIRTDVPRYRVFEHGELIDEPRDIRNHWRDDLVIFALGCSFSFEDALMQDGIELRHITHASRGADVSHLDRDHRGGPVPRPARGLDAAAQTRRRDPRDPDHHPLSRRARRAGAHRQAGADRYQGHRRPDYGDAVPVNDDEIPVFWACGVTPQSVVATVKPEFCITHYPGSMLVTDRKNSEFAIL